MTDKTLAFSTITEVNMQRAHKIRIYPTKEQEVQLRKTAGCARYAYNWALAKWKSMYEDYTNGVSTEKPSAVVLSKLWTQEREEWAKETARCAQTKAILNVGVAFQNLWRGIGKYPTFHKKGRRDSFYVANDRAQISNGRIRLPNIGKVRLAEDLRYQGKIMSYTVSHYADQWHVSVQVDIQDDVRPQCEAPASTVGIDVGLHTPATTSDGSTLQKPPRIERLKQRLKQAQRVLARRQKGSHNRQKALRRQQKIQLKINNIRTDVLHKFTTAIAKNHGIVVVESLDAKSMMEGDNSLVRKGMTYSVMGMLIHQLSYKAQQCIKADKYFPSTKMCSHCGHVRDSITLDERTYVCPDCGLTIDRDMNAAINLMNYAGRVTPGEPVDSVPRNGAEAGSTTLL